MTTSTPVRQPKVTYSVIGGNMDEINSGFETALAALRARPAATYYPVIDGTSVAGTGPSFESRSPIDRSVHLATFTTAANEQIDAAVAAARAARAGWAAAPFAERIAILHEVAETIRARRNELAAALSVEIGKTRFESLGDAEEAADLIDYYAAQIENNNGYVRPLGQLMPNEQTQDVLRPYGVFAVIAPFNFPASLAIGMSGAAMLTGNTVVFKPAETASLVGALLAQIYAESRLPSGVFNIIYGDGKAGAYLAGHQHVDGVAFTGSRDVGMELLRTVGAGGSHAKPVLAELGGKNAAIVTRSADLESAAEGIVRSSFSLQGQKCSACSRVYVDKAVADDLIARIVAKTNALVMGDPTELNVYVGPVIDEAAAQRFDEAVRSAKNGGTILAGGARKAGGAFDNGPYVQPTIAQLPLDHELFGRELFLPFLSLGVVESFDEALAEANRCDYGLTGGLFSQDDTEIERFFNEAEAGVLYVNRTTGATTGAWPGVQSFCGWKASGLTGKGGCGPYYPAQFLREQSRTRMI